MLAAGRASSSVRIYAHDTKGLREFREGFMEEVTFQLTLKGAVGSTGHPRQGRRPV